MPEKVLKGQNLGSTKSQWKSSVVLLLLSEGCLWAFRKGITCQVWPHGLKVIESYIFNKKRREKRKKRGMQHEDFPGGHPS